MRQFLAACCLLAFSAGSLTATTVVKLDFGQLSRLATQIVAGKIVKVEAVADASTGYIYSNIEIALSKSSSPFLPKTQTIRMMGGEIGDRRVYIAGMPHFKPGEEVVLFLAGQAANSLTSTVGMWQGVFYVDRDAASGAATIVDHQRHRVTAVREGRLVRAAGGGTKELSAPGLSLERFFQEVERYRATSLAVGQ